MTLVKIDFTEQPKEYNELWLFRLSDLMWETISPLYDAIRNSKGSTQEKIDKILKVKHNINKVFSNADTWNILKDYFTTSWAIQITADDYEEMIDNFKLVDKDGNIFRMDDQVELWLVEDLKFFFLDLNKNSLSFRNKRYYFLFNSIKIEGIDDIQYHDFASINDLRIDEIDVEQFEKELYVQFNRIDQYLRFFSSYILNSFFHNTINNLDWFCDSFIDEIGKKIEWIKKFNFKDSPDSSFNNIIQEQIDHSINILNNITVTVEDLKKCGSPDCILRFINYLNIHKTDIDFIKQTFWIDINKILRSHLDIDIPKSIKKFILWLLDAKINILAFVQNLSQILWNKNFLDPGFKWDLVLSKYQVTHLNNTSPDVISEYKELQEEYNKEQNDATGVLSAELDININLFLDILLWDHMESYLYAVIPSVVNGFPEAYEWLVEKEVDYFKSTFWLLKQLYSWIQKYWVDLDKKIQKKYERLLEKHEKKIKNGLESKEPIPIKPFRNKNYLDAFASINKKLIRFHREEDNPLSIIKTAQNSFNHIVNNSYKPDDRLHILSVNYWGSLVWYFAKHVFHKLNDNNQMLITYWNIVYSIYDLKNANDFLSIIDYPFKEFMWEEIWEELKRYHKEKNHLLIFDDNTSSWKTLYNLSELAKKTWCYWKIDAFACRVSNKANCYDDSIPEDFVLDLVENATTRVRKIRLWHVRRWYKELVWAVIVKWIYKKIKDPFS